MLDRFTHSESGHMRHDDARRKRIEQLGLHIEQIRNSLICIFIGIFKNVEPNR
jgi:hypothetical protein